MKRHNVTMNDIKRFEIIKEWIGGVLDGNQASMLLGVSRRHAFRLKKAFKEKGIEGIIPKERGGRKAIPENLKEKIAILVITCDILRKNNIIRISPLFYMYFSKPIYKQKVKF